MDKKHPDRGGVIREVIAGGKDAAPDLPPKDPEGEGPRLPDGCPVVPLGVRGGRFNFLDVNGEHIELPAMQVTRRTIMGLYGHKNYLLEEHFPRLNKKGEPNGCEYEAAEQALIAAASRKGPWDPYKHVRGRGAWLGDAGELVLHCGDVILLGDRWAEPGLIGRHVYPAAPAVPRPWPRPVAGGARGPGDALLSLLRTWTWRRPELDPLLLLGWIGAGALGGALHWRPVIFVTGDSGTGKSTLQKMLEILFDGALLSVSEPSAAGIRQTIKHATLPIAIDEEEASEDARRGNNLIKLARLAASGTRGVRGGADHEGIDFVIRSAFLFSAINIPSLLHQDRNRMAILELADLRPGVAPLDLAPKRMRELYEQLLRRLVDGWHRWPATLDLYRRAIAGLGQAERAADVFGTLLAIADVLLHDAEPNYDHARALAEQLEETAFGDEDSRRDEEQCLMHLTSSSLPLDGPGLRRTVGEWVEAVMSKESTEFVIDEANRTLGTYGVKVASIEGKFYFAVANNHAGLERVFAGTRWGARPGTVGVWVQSLRRLPTAAKYGMLRFGGAAARCTLLDIKLAKPEPEIPVRPHGRSTIGV